MFGESSCGPGRCHTLGTATAVLQANGGSWPGMPEYKEDALPPNMKSDPMCVRAEYIARVAHVL